MTPKQVALVQDSFASLASTVDRLSAHEPNRAEGMTEPEIAGTALPTVDQTQVTDVTT
jgi:hypothetical protein